MFADDEAAEHAGRVGHRCALIARHLRWDAEACARLRAAGTLHDVGKIAVPRAVLRKPGKLTAEERVLVEAHAQAGHDILAGSCDDVLELAALIALTHHERFDGTGYPHGLRGEEIPLASRIAAVADVFDALTHDRVYRAALPAASALEILRAERGSHFDPTVLDAFETGLAEIERLPWAPVDKFPLALGSDRMRRTYLANASSRYLRAS